jgi:hypothetical protein
MYAATYHTHVTVLPVELPFFCQCILQQIESKNILLHYGTVTQGVEENIWTKEG